MKNLNCEIRKKIWYNPTDLRKGKVHEKNLKKSKTPEQRFSLIGWNKCEEKVANVNWTKSVSKRSIVFLLISLK